MKAELVEMIQQIFELLRAIAGRRGYRKIMRHSVGDLVYVLTLYMQVTQEQMVAWSEDICKFIKDEDEGPIGISVRATGLDILMTICEHFKSKFLSGIDGAIKRHNECAETERANNRLNWWKRQEAAMLVVGAQTTKKLILAREQFNLYAYLFM